MSGMSPDLDVASGVRVVSTVPGRIRVRAVDEVRRRRLASLSDEVSALPGVTSVSLRAKSASLVVRFAAGQEAAVMEGLQSLGVDLTARGRRATAGDPVAVLMTAASGANRAVGQRLDGTDLRVLVPLGLGLLATRRAMRGDDRLVEAPWYVLAWYASELFWKFHGDADAAVRLKSEGE